MQVIVPTRPFTAGFNNFGVSWRKFIIAARSRVVYRLLVLLLKCKSLKLLLFYIANIQSICSLWVFRSHKVSLFNKWFFMQNSILNYNILLFIFSLQFEIYVDVLKLLLTTIGKRLQCTRHNFFGNLIFDVKIKTHLKTVRSF